jgi:hypothetical protein
MNKSAFFFSAIAFSAMTASALEIPNGSFEQPEIRPPVEVFTPGQPGYAEAAPKLSWDFGAQAGVCPQNVHFAERVSAADSRQVAFMQGNNADNNPAVDPPSSIFGINVTGLEVGKEYEISRQQAERATDTGKGAITA